MKRRWLVTSLTVVAVAALAVLAVILGDLLLGVGALKWPAYEPERVEIVRSRIRIGDERAQVQQALADAWYHGDCTHDGGAGDDLFLYGPHDRQNVQVILVTYEIVGGRALVQFIGSEEPDRLGLYECVPDTIFNK